MIINTVIFLLFMTILWKERNQEQLLLLCLKQRSELHDRLFYVMETINQEKLSFQNEFYEIEFDKKQNIMNFLQEILANKQQQKEKKDELCEEKMKELTVNLQKDYEKTLKQLVNTENELKKSKLEIDELKEEATLIKNTVRKEVENLKNTAKKNQETLKKQLFEARESEESIRQELQELKDSIGVKHNEKKNIKEDEPLLDLNLPQEIDDDEEIFHKPKSKLDCSKLSFEFNKKRKGRSFLTQTVTSANRCKRLCLSEDDCQAWNYVSSTSECQLKASIEETTDNNCCVTGIRCEN